MIEIGPNLKEVIQGTVIIVAVAAFLFVMGLMGCAHEPAQKTNADYGAGKKPWVDATGYHE